MSSSWDVDSGSAKDKATDAPSMDSNIENMAAMKLGTSDNDQSSGSKSATRTTEAQSEASWDVVASSSTLRSVDTQGFSSSDVNWPTGSDDYEYLDNINFRSMDAQWWKARDGQVPYFVRYIMDNKEKILDAHSSLTMTDTFRM
jgi:hypothetical protein